MRIKRFEAASTHSAMAMVKEELGEDAVILSTRTIPEKSGSNRKKPRIEVVAAMESDHEPLVVSGPSEPEGEPEPRRPTAAGYGYHTLRRPAAKVAAPIVKEASGKAPGENPRAPEPAPPEEPPLSFVEDDSRIHLEANDLRLRFANFLRQRYCSSPEDEGAPVRSSSFGEADGGAAPPDSHQVAQWRDKIIDQLRIAPLELGADQEGPTVVAMIGPTGVGKTTTAAKLAAWFSIHEGLRVALLSMDCYRIGATDQLRTYAKIMRLPCEIALRKKDLRAALLRHQDKDLIIVDTAGKSPYDPTHTDELQDWFALCDRIAPYLVLSATSKKEDLQHILKVYEALPVKGLVLSKLDETRAYAALCQQLASTSLPISCLCIGQRVPEDFLLASRDFLHALFGQGWQAATGELDQVGQGRWNR